MHKSTTQRVKQSMSSMLIMRPISAIAGFAILLLLSRFLPTNDYGQFFAVWAIVEILILVSDAGLPYVVYRYVSASESENGKIVANGPLWRLVNFRLFTLIITCLVFAIIFGSTDWQINETKLDRQALFFVVLILLFEGIARFIENIFDSMLCQGRSQLSLVARSTFRLIGYVIFMSQGLMDFQHVLYVDVIATLLGATMGGYMLLDLTKKSNHSGQFYEKAVIGFARMFHFAMPAFIAQLFGMIYGVDVLKLILSNTSGNSELALFGFAFSLAAVVQRYIPANLFSGVFRPVFVAASKKPNSQKVLSELLSISIKVNWLVILPIFCFLFFGGESLAVIISSGNYSNAGVVILILIAGMLSISIHLTFSMYCLAIESSWPLLYASIAAGVIGLPLGVILAISHGAIGVSIAFGISELIWSATCFLLLRYKINGILVLDWIGFIKLIASVVGAILFCLLLQDFFIKWRLILAILAPLIFYIIAYLLKIFSRQERDWLMSVLPFNPFNLVR